MIYISSVFDRNYLHYGIALLESLRFTYGNDFEFHCLCLDDKSFEVMNGVSSQAIPYDIKDLENSHEELLDAKITRPYNEYCWTLASWFSNHLLGSVDIPHIIYIDSDIWFLSDSRRFFEECLEKSVGILRHRHILEGHPDGGYNVGVVSFRNDEVGKKTLGWWKDCVLKREPLHLATCGDQKFLDAFPDVAGKGNIKFVDENFSYGAPWTYRLYGWADYLRSGDVLWGGVLQPLVFVHFARIQIDYKTKEVTPVSDPRFSVHTLNDGVFSIPEVSLLYHQYADRLFKIDDEYNL